jgi:GH25 family lysozyme M1 (1,4-beta-N-acetylmuramidase)
MEFGIDVSHHNEVKDWHKVRENNITFASVKVTDGTEFVDPQARHHVPGARAAGIRTGGYHFARKGDIDAQVALFFKHLHARALLSSASMAPMLDMEASELRGTANTFIPEFIAKLRAKAGIKRVFVYANLDWFEHVLRPDEWADANVMLWVARFNGSPGKPGFSHPKLVLHQHTEEGNVPGIPGHVDRDATVGTHKLADLLVKAPAPTPA